MKTLQYIALVVLLLTAAAPHAAAKKKPIYGQNKLYVFGFSSSFNDSTVYLTDIHTIDSVWMNNKANFLINRDNYTWQLRNHVEAAGLPHRTCAIFFAKKQKQIEKRMARVVNRSEKRGNVVAQLPVAPAADGTETTFRFTTIPLDDEEIALLLANTEKEKKEKRKRKDNKGMGGPGGGPGNGGPGNGGPGGGPGGGGAPGGMGGGMGGRM